ncbi:MAG: nucleotide exchange factor GrpE [Candidatus Dojkabacteria bacterium]|nr:MAG: nucleotide exchange factor GrpE [Candidatus Dojkabacteria bacterium]
MKKDTKQKKTTITKESNTVAVEKIQELEARLESVTRDSKKIGEEKEALLTQLKKSLADYQNLEQAIDRRVELRMFQMRKEMASELITIAEDMNYAIGESREMHLDVAGKAWLEGVVNILGKLRSAMSQIGIRAIEVKPGDRFDPELHEAIAIVNLGEDNTIHALAEGGYVLDDLVIRPAKVVVNKVPAN